MTSPLAEKQERLLSLFKLAIEREQDAQKLYAEMLFNCEDEELRHLIETFQAAEQQHEEMLMNKYAALRETEKYKE
jgi:rubrerythrin